MIYAAAMTAKPDQYDPMIMHNLCAIWGQVDSYGGDAPFVEWPVNWRTFTPYGTAP